MKPKVFLDSDVIISSLISKRGAAYLLLHSNQIIPIISTGSQIEITAVCQRLNIPAAKFMGLQPKLTILTSPTPAKIKHYHTYTSDPNDTQILSSAHLTRCRFLATYNQRHYYSESIKRDLGLQVVSPGQLLQYLRSQPFTN